MDKPLSDMTLKELWELFPITLSEPKSCWEDWFEEEKQALTLLLCIEEANIHHIGSTAVQEIWAKPIIDILVELPENCPMADIKEALVNGGYLCMSETEDRISLNKGYTSQGFAERVFHIHLRYNGDHDELYFRDYMNGHPAIAKGYEQLKLSLWKQYEHDRDGYTHAKSAFVKKYTECAKTEYQNKYENLSQEPMRVQRNTKEERG